MSEADRAKWDARWAEATPGAPPRWLDTLDAELPRAGRALDVAAGAGRLALYAARRGMDAVAIDVSPVGLARAADAARAEGLALTPVTCDLEADPTLPAGPFALVTCFHYEQPALWPAMIAALAPGGLLVAEIATARNLERHARPSRRYLVEPNALLHRVADDLEIVLYREGWLPGDDGIERHLARLAARRWTRERSSTRLNRWAREASAAVPPSRPGAACSPGRR